MNGGKTTLRLRPRRSTARCCCWQPFAYYILQNIIVAQQGRDSKLAAAIGHDFKGKLSPILCAIAIPVSFFRPWLAGCIYLLVALMWLMPDRRIERVVDESGPSAH